MVLIPSKRLTVRLEIVTVSGALLGELLLVTCRLSCGEITGESKGFLVFVKGE